ncbi:cytochrome P450 [Mycolicibacterium thermoresistibile]
MSAATFASPLGLMRAMTAGADPVGFFRRRAADDRPFALDFPGLGHVVFFGSKDAVRDILTLPVEACRAPLPNPIEPVVGPGSLILLSGTAHRRERSLLTPAFHGERVKSYADIIAAATTEEIAKLPADGHLAVQQLSVAITLHVAIRVIFSVADIDRRTEYTDAVTALMRANTAPLMLMPALRRDLGRWSPWSRLLRLRDHLDELLSGDMDSRTERGLLGRDMLDVLLAATDEDGRRHTTEELHDQLRTLLAAGHETTATSLTWALYHIYRDDAVRERLEAELATCRTPMEMTALPYLNSVIKETLRMHPPVPIVLRQLATGQTIDGTAFAESDIVGIALYSLHYNPTIWDDPERFDDRRFLGRRYSPFEFAPFGGGHRRCIGAGFAAAELAIAIGTIIANVDLRMSERERHRPPPRGTARGIAVAPNRDITLDIIDR